ncbi:MAG: glucosidase [Chloroflexi bacterium]|nr:glucosidase [Chloroflexota bacterium]
MSSEHRRLMASGAAWRRWGPYLAERAWGTVREDYSPDGSAWDYLPHDHARSRAYRWNEDGLAGLCDDQQRLCFALALWNGVDPILKERLFGLAGPEGNHGEDVKECYFYLDSTPTHSYLRMLYKYPHGAFPYAELVEENRRRARGQPEYDVIDTGIFGEGRYFDVFVEYAKAAPDDILIRMTAVNRGPDAAALHLLPTLWYRNTWSWGRAPYRPLLRRAESCGDQDTLVVEAEHRELGTYVLACEGAAALLFAENETNLHRLFGVPNPVPYVKDAFHQYVVHGDTAAVNPAAAGTKVAAHYVRTIGPGEPATIRLRLTARAAAGRAKETGETGETERAKATGAAGDEWEHDTPFARFDAIFAQRRKEADEFYAAVHHPALDEDERRVQRRALAGLLWSKQFYYYDVDQWLEGDPAQPPPPPKRRSGRNSQWRTLNTADVLVMPDKWEYPWFASWDHAFHCVSLALVDAELAKEQLVLLGREWYQHPNGQIPAYEWDFGDVNPPVLAWAASRVYQLDRAQRGAPDRAFLERIFHKLLLNFTWWVNRKDREGNNIFEGGFLGLDNIGVFDRSAMLPDGGSLEQSDGTAWMAMYGLNLMTIALELACEDSVYEDIATKFFEHFLYIARAMDNIAAEGIALWDDGDEFFYDVLHLSNGTHRRLKVRSLVGLIPLLAVETIEPDLLDELPQFKARLEWFLEHRPDLARLVSRWHVPGAGERRLLALTRGHRMKRLLKRALDPDEFLSDYGIRSLSRHHDAQPYELWLDGTKHTVRYEPAESRSGLFGGNSNWRGPVWLPINYLLIEALRRFHQYYSDDFLVECPTGSGQYLTLDQIADELCGRLTRLFLRGEDGRRPFNGQHDVLQHDPHFRDRVLFHEYFHGDTGQGLGASHQTGWTALVANLLQEHGARRSAMHEAQGSAGRRASQ